MKKELKFLFNEDFIPERRYAGKLSEISIRGYKSAFELYSKIQPEVIYPSDITKKSVVNFFEKLETRKRIIGKGREKRGVEKSTVATYWSKLNTFFVWLKRNKHIDTNPFDDMDYPSVDYIDRKFLQREQIEKVFNSVDFTIRWKNNFIRKRNI